MIGHDKKTNRAKRMELERGDVHRPNPLSWQAMHARLWARSWLAAQPAAAAVGPELNPTSSFHGQKFAVSLAVMLFGRRQNAGEELPSDSRHRQDRPAI